MSEPIKLLILITEDWYFQSHRADLVTALVQQGFDVTVGTNLNNSTGLDPNLKSLCRHVPFKRGVDSLLGEIRSSINLLLLIRKTRADIVHAVALKPILLSTLSLFLFRKVQFVNAFSGMGYIFSDHGDRVGTYFSLVRFLLRKIAKRKNSWTLVQNVDDQEFLLRNNYATQHRLFLIRGSGINTETVKHRKETKDNDEILIVLAARMLRDKGVEEFGMAATQLRNEHQLRLVLVGGLDPTNPAALSAEEIHRLTEPTNIEWWGRVDDMDMVYRSADVVCLPSYREGLPKVLLEAASYGIPLVATDVPGCRDICRHNSTGLIVPARDASALAGALRQIGADAELRTTFGENARQLVREEFSLTRIVPQTVEMYRTMSRELT